MEKRKNGDFGVKIVKLDKVKVWF